LSNLKIVVRV